MEASLVSTLPDLSPAERLHRSEASGRALVAGWESSGMTMRAYAKQVGVQAQRVSYWRLRLRKRKAKNLSDPVGFVEIPRQTPVNGCGVSIALPSGVRLHVERGFDAAVLRSVVAALSVVDAAAC